MKVCVRINTQVTHPFLLVYENTIFFFNLQLVPGYTFDNIYWMRFVLLYSSLFPLLLKQVACIKKKTL